MIKKKKWNIRKVVILSLMSVVLFTSGTTVFGAIHFSNSTHTWDTVVSGLGSQSRYWHRTKAHSATVTKGDKIASQSKSANLTATARLFEFSGCNFYYNNW
ncbi:lactococcin 972 family bacteriocin [Enterococcus saccharolyticus]|uniref:Bacteriocin n=1 Tax=Enterococcus saccharolyticus subsp. saccharolyticus ATCC 43076 TaxID=1139996 RepID=S0NNG0_9ENTE|nr:lactococcin 972 family bacteriocin [Enterococcus saccharolyticus]EOT26269.1 hypothetical protein OMQ_02318 [Enterococcus saccharolyticus subsp. saccharolyticus ATCC 43076]EOT82784.1 hypothetical protein I572_00324 [Enterococcus saccharolyticus subsp. saccharolyticus ATCC 43076]OJG91145.1 hypothetical protein RV16_GL000131 [Enterococcus saccharolyticus]